MSGLQKTADISLKSLAARVAGWNYAIDLCWDSKENNEM